MELAHSRDQRKALVAASLNLRLLLSDRKLDVRML